MAGSNRDGLEEERDVFEMQSVEESASELYGRTAFYNHASERSLSHAEAKMIYERHIMDASEQDQQRPLRRIWTSSSIENGGLSMDASCT